MTFATWFLIFGLTGVCEDCGRTFMVPDLPTKAACERLGMDEHRKASARWKPSDGKIVWGCYKQKTPPG